MTRLYIQYGCGLVAPPGWINFDASPTLLIQKMPLLGKFARPWLNCEFPHGVRYGCIVRGLPIADASVDGVFCSHVLEHLPLEDFHVALSNTLRILKPGGMFRCIVPDLETYARIYLDGLNGNPDSISEAANIASIQFMKKTCLGRLTRPKGLRSLMALFIGNSDHRWMWDKFSLMQALQTHGFVSIKAFEPNRCEDEMFLLPEEVGQFVNAIALECRKK